MSQTKFGRQLKDRGWTKYVNHEGKTMRVPPSEAPSKGGSQGQTVGPTVRQLSVLETGPNTDLQTVHTVQRVTQLSEIETNSNQSVKAQNGATHAHAHIRDFQPEPSNRTELSVSQQQSALQRTDSYRQLGELSATQSQPDADLHDQAGASFARQGQPGNGQNGQKFTPAEFLGDVDEEVL